MSLNNQSTHSLSVTEILTCFFVGMVLFVHHDHYTVYYLGWLEKFLPLQEMVAYVAVGGFIFLSGYKLTKSKIGDTFTQFFKNRFMRIYPLFFLALITFTIVLGPFDPINFVVHALFLQGITPQLVTTNYATLWFVPLIFLLYGTFHFLKKYISLPAVFLRHAIMIFSILFITNQVSAFLGFEILTASYFKYYFIFIAGVFFSYYETTITHSPLARHFKWLGLLLCAPLLLITLHSNNPLMELISTLLQNVAAITLYLLLFSSNYSWRLSGAPGLKKIMTKISFASFCIFLFHRPVWSIMTSLWPTKDLPQWLYIIILGVPLIVMCGYGIQYGYNKLINVFNHKGHLAAA